MKSETSTPPCGALNTSSVAKAGSDAANSKAVKIRRGIRAPLLCKREHFAVVAHCLAADDDVLTVRFCFRRRAFLQRHDGEGILSRRYDRGFARLACCRACENNQSVCSAGAAEIDTKRSRGRAERAAGLR